MPPGEIEKSPPEDESEIVTIPLDRIRRGSAFNHFRELEPEIFRVSPEKKDYYKTAEGGRELTQRYERSMLYQIDRAISSMLNKTEVRQGFAVEGTDREAIKEVYDVLVKGKKSAERFSTETEVTVVFFARPKQPGIRLDKIERKRNEVEIRYMFIPNTGGILTHYLALIPLGKLPASEYQVKTVRLTEKEPQRDYVPSPELGIEKQLVCRPFSFVVVDFEDEEKKANSASRRATYLGKGAI
jgi:hypothetical protein